MCSIYEATGWWVGLSGVFENQSPAVVPLDFGCLPCLALVEAALFFWEIVVENCGVFPGLDFASLGLLEPSIRIELPFLRSIIRCPEICTEVIWLEEASAFRSSETHCIDGLLHFVRSGRMNFCRQFPMPRGGKREWHGLCERSATQTIITMKNISITVALALTAASATAQESPKPDAQMKAVLDELASLGGKPLVELSAEDSRKQPTPADAVMSLLKKKGESTAPTEVGKVENTQIPVGDHKIEARIYRPKGDGPFPVIHYIHGGGWVIADLDTYDSSPRSLCKQTGALVISTHYRQAPEHKFPAAHEDTFGAYQWILENSGKWDGNGKNVAVVGESAGGNMAAAICLMAKKEGIQMPVHQVLIYPVVGTDMNTPSYKENADAKPLSAPLMKWFFDMTLVEKSDGNDPRLALLKAESLEGMPPATIITAEIDPLRSEGKDFADKLEAAGVAVTYKSYEGVTHEFFGMGAVVDKAKEAVELASTELKESFEKTSEK